MRKDTSPLTNDKTKDSNNDHDDDDDPKKEVEDTIF